MRLFCGARARGRLTSSILETLQGLVEGAELAGLPLDLQISKNCAAYHGGLERWRSRPRCCPEGPDSHRRCIWTMPRAKRWPCRPLISALAPSCTTEQGWNTQENLLSTARVVEYAHSKGVYVRPSWGKGGKTARMSRASVPTPRKPRRS